MKIKSKRQFFELWEAGVLGNRTRLWRDPHRAFWWAAGRAILGQEISIGFREIGKGGGGAWERVPWDETIRTAIRWASLGRTFIMDDGCPDDKRIFQGEICRTIRGLEGFLDVTSTLPMRPAMAAGHMKVCSYLQTKDLLDRFMDPSSRDDIDRILDLYPDATIEFSTFSVDVGIFPGRNTLFWETRDY